RGDRVQQRNRARHALNPPNLLGDLFAELGKELGLEFQNPLFRAEHLRLILLEFGGRISLRIDQRLLAFVIGRNSIFIGVADLDEISEYVVEFDLERRDAGAPALARLYRGDVALAASGQVSQLIELSVESVAYHARFIGRRWRVIGDGAGDERSDVFQLVHIFDEGLKQRGAGFGQMLAQGRDDFDRLSKRYQIARVRPPQRDLADEPLQIG